MTYPPGPHGPQGHNYPPPPPQPYSTGPDQFSALPKKSSAPKWALLGVVVLAAIVVAAGAVFYFARDRGATEASQVRSGDCLTEIPDSSRVLYVKTVSCDQPHKGEVFAVLPLPDGAFPGDAAVVKYADKCAPALNEYAPNANSESGIQLFVLYPTADSWQRGDRSVTCIATSKNPRTGKIE
ncbi:Septum formation [Mycobacterium sp. 88mf]|uniref:septum formation family protein n=1 Tax=Mycolicibacterium septicum TaxID=98668 RepID=UPI0008AB54B3|nr:septum formation family protein [Mycolicibacterium septicum]QRY53503.1 septum formation family protein [Mycolicibacterium septicum]SEP77909.1 Septum formation [Mycobacterium sp. 88mf]SFF15851.1 Septum formation [Mycobacterium sp. 455mf]